MNAKDGTKDKETQGRRGESAKCETKYAKWIRMNANCATDRCVPKERMCKNTRLKFAEHATGVGNYAEIDFFIRLT